MKGDLVQRPFSRRKNNFLYISMVNGLLAMTKTVPQFCNKEMRHDGDCFVEEKAEIL